MMVRGDPMPPERDGVALAAVAGALFRGRRYQTPGQYAERISGQTAGFTGFQEREKPGQLRAGRAAQILNG